MEKFSCKGTTLERGKVTEVVDDGYRVASIDRPGLITAPLKTFGGSERYEGDFVYFALFQDGDGFIMDNAGGGSGASANVIVVTTGSFSTLPQTITNASITSDLYLVESVLSNPMAQVGNWTVTTNNGSLTISGTISGSTTATLIFAGALTSIPIASANVVGGIKAGSNVTISSDGTLSLGSLANLSYTVVKTF